MIGKNSGGPAFPHVSSTGYAGQPGMSKREYYAAHAPVTLNEATHILAERDELSHMDAVTITPKVMAFFAQLRFEYADAMIAAEAGER